MKMTITIEMDTQKEIDEVLTRLNGPGQKSSTPAMVVVKEPIKVEDIPETPAEEVTNEEYTEDSVRQLASKAIKAGHRSKVKAELDKVGAANITLVKPEQYVEFAQAINNILNG